MLWIYEYDRRAMTTGAPQSGEAKRFVRQLRQASAQPMAMEARKPAPLQRRKKQRGCVLKVETMAHSDLFFYVKPMLMVFTQRRISTFRTPTGSVLNVEMDCD